MASPRDDRLGGVRDLYRLAFLAGSVRQVHNRRSGAAPTDQIAFGSELIERRAYRVARNAEILRQCASGRQGVAGKQGSIMD